jgi:hypothetical protein
MASTLLLGLSLPADGTTNWGTLANTSITSLIDTSIAGTTTISSTTTPYILTDTTEATNEARQAVILCTGSRSGVQTIVAPQRSKTYVVINATTGSQAVKIAGTGPTTGVTVPNGRAYMVAWNGSDFVITGITTVSLTSDVTGTLPVANGGTGQTSYTDGQLLIGNSTGSTLTKATLTAGSGVTITNGSGSINISATGSGGTVTSVTGASPVASSGGNTPSISLASGYGDTQNPYASKTANYVLAAPTGSAGAPTFRAIVGSDIPTLNQNTTGTAAGLSATLAVSSGGTGQTSYTDGQLLIGNSTGNTLTKATLTAGTGISVTNSAGAISVTNTAPDQTVSLTGSGGTSISGTYPNFTITSTNTTYSTATSSVNGLIKLGSDTVQTTAANAVSSDASRTYALQLNASGQAVVNVPWTGGSGGSVTGVTATSPVASSGGTAPVISLNAGYGDTLNPYASKTASHFLAAPNGTAGVPSFRAVAASDIPVLNQNTTGTAAGLSGSQTANTVYAAPNGSAGAATFRALVAADIPTLNQNTSGTAAGLSSTLAVASGGTGATTAQGAMNTFAGATTAGQYLRGNGSNVTMSAIQAADVPTLNQNTTGSAATVTTTISSGATATTQTAGDNSTKVATTAYVQTAVSSVSYAGSKSQVFTSSGTFTVPTGISAVKVTVIGGGGGGSGSNYGLGGGSGGGGAGVAVRWITGLTPGGTVTVTIGTAGSAGTATPTSGGAGGTSSFGAYASATGGSGGVPFTISLPPAGGAGGTGSSGDLNLSGGKGGIGQGSGCTYESSGGGGGSGMNSGMSGPMIGFTGYVLSGNAVSPGGSGYVGGHGGDGVLGASGSYVGAAGTGYGNGGAGGTGSSGSVAGGAGSAGIVIVEW